MKIGRRGKDLAVRIPKRLVDQFGLKVGDMIDSEVFVAALERQRAKSEHK